MMLSKYTKRHEHALAILLHWFKSNLNDKHELYADFDTASVMPITDLFLQFRPDIAIKHFSQIDILELTVCHESNLTKKSKYQNLKNYIVTKDENISINIFTLKISILDPISDLELFLVYNLKEKCPQVLKQNYPDQFYTIHTTYIAKETQVIKFIETCQ